MMKLKYIGNDGTCLIPGKIYECSASIGIIVKGAFNQRHGISTMARNSPEDYCIYLICDESIECGENITIGRLYTNVESFLKNWERVSNV